MTTVLDELGRGLNRAWASFAEGWRELPRGARSALTHYIAGNRGGAGAGGKVLPGPELELVARGGDVERPKTTATGRMRRIAVQ